VSAIALAKWSWHFLLLYPFVTFFLWLYSRYFKKMVLLGNVAVSCFCAGAVLMFWYPGIVIEDKASFIAFGIFAFLLTMVREIVKDLEDVEGDRSVGDRTLPIVYGITAAKVTGVFFLACTMAGLIISGLIPGLSLSLASVFWLAALGTMCYCAYRLLAKVAEKEDFHHISTLLKITMMIGVLYFLAT
jgi:4-hydroxybenzoate polyprenyltransferase